MKQITIQLSDHNEEFIEEQLAASKYQSAEELINDVVKAFRQNLAEEELIKSLHEGLKSSGRELTPEVMDEIFENALSKCKEKVQTEI